MECRQCGGNGFRRRYRPGVLEDSGSNLGFHAWECRACHNVCFARQHGLAMVADPGRQPRLLDWSALPGAAGPLSPSLGYTVPRPVAVR